METLERLIAEHPFFKGLEDRYIQLVVGCASNVRFDGKQFLFREGEEANMFYIIRTGKVALEINAVERGSLIIDTIEPGEVLGWSWFVAPYRWRFDARALELTRAIALDGKCLRTKCEDDHHLGYELMKRVSAVMEQRLHAARVQLMDLYGSPT
jgi:CRP/FNR family cyclic AMP-dependent transcriptional regulator